MRKLMAVLAVLCAIPATARESGTDLFNWFMRIGGRYPCAHFGTAHVVALDQWICATDNGPCAVALLEDEWQPIAPLAMVDEENHIGPAVVWLGEDGDIVCFMPGVRT